MEEIKKILDGNKTYLTGIATIILTILNQYGLIDPDLFWTLVTGLAGLAAIFLRMGLKKTGAQIEVPPPVVIPTETLPTTNEAVIALLKDLVAKASQDDPPKGAA